MTSHNDYKPTNEAEHPSSSPQDEAEWLDDLHHEDSDIQEIAADLKAAYEQMGSPHPLEHGHWLALATAIVGT